MFGNAPRTSEISVADAMDGSVVTRNYLKKYFGQLQRVAGAGLHAVFLAGAGLLGGWHRRRSVK